MKHINFILLYFLVSCAQQTPLTGGQKDVTPPQLDSLRTHPSSLATSFNEYTSESCSIGVKDITPLRN